MMVFKSKKRRYPGTKPFTRDQASLFFGRTDDIKKLNELIALEPVVVVYGKSGYGKSSLINAGLLPQLENLSSNLCLMPRLNAWTDKDSISPLGKTRESIKELSKDYNILDKVLEDDDTLWRKLKAFQMANPDQRLHLFFDQFEELFTYPASQIEEFKIQLAELVRKQVPRRYERALDTKGDDEAEVLTFEEEDLLYKRLNLRLVFIIRSDKMHLLDQLSDYIPRILRNNYEIKALNRPSAASALIEPALLEGKDYLTPPFKYEKSAQDKVLDFLEDDNSKLVEAIQLQILATSFEDRVLKDQLRILDADNIGNLESIVKNYYNDRLRSIGNHEEIALASKMIEEGLVDKERHQRLTLHEGQIKSIYEVDEVLLNRLVENHLLRRQPDSRSGYNYELSHDTLIAPVLAARTIREQKEAEEEHLNTQKQLTREKSRRRKATIIAGFAILASIIAGITAISAWRNYKALNTTQAQLDKRENEISRAKITQDSLTQEAGLLKSAAGEALEAAARDSTRAAQLLLVAQEADRNARMALEQAQKARESQVAAEIEREKSYSAFLDEVKRADTLKAYIGGGETNLNYQVDFLMEEGYSQIANENFQAALTSFANAKFIFRDTLRYYNRNEIEKQLSNTTLASIAENEFKRGLLYAVSEKYEDLMDDFRVKAPLWSKRLEQIQSSGIAFEETIGREMVKVGDIYDIRSLEFLFENNSNYLITWPIYRNADLVNLNKVVFNGSSSELFLEGLPESVDTLIITNASIKKIPTVDYYLNEIEYLSITDCKNLQEIDASILKYEFLETLELRDNPALESVTFNWEDLIDLKKVRLSGNHNVLFVLTGYTEAAENSLYDGYPYSAPIESIVLEDVYYDPDVPIMGMDVDDGSPDDQAAFWADFVFSDYGVETFDSLKHLTIDNIFLSDLQEQEFDFTYWENLEELNLKNLPKTKLLDFYSGVNTNMKKLHLESMPIENEVSEILRYNPYLETLILIDLPMMKADFQPSLMQKIEDLMIIDVPDASLNMDFIRSLPNLKMLKLKDVKMDGDLKNAELYPNSVTHVEINGRVIK